MNPVLQRIIIHQRDELPDLVKLDVSKLGRPWHRLPKVMNDKFDVIDTRLSIYFLKKLRVNAALKAMTFAIDQHYKNTQLFSTPYGNIGFVIDRILLLHILHDFYGLNTKDGNLVSEQDDTSQVTKTEERLKNILGQELTSLIVNKDTFGEDLEIKSDYSTIISQWSWCVTFELDGYDYGRFSILFDHHHVSKMLESMRVPEVASENTAKQNGFNPAHIEQLFYRLPLRLTGRLANLKLTVNQLGNINPGDIIPIHLNQTLPVFIGKEQIFDATIAEDDGKLFFCELNDKTVEKHYE
ncbi:flagellar motor switch protein FliM [Chania multitudinisentens RB-25]|uniref:Flagellar motor switch protein FliM n=1 Tax=Chania multitudinisentens RB-25 TaxID=1441930 RepID=W0L7D4_9GAMM|nr:FliM/FliN family flagellar motor switch protein [Chania multitudinisentens]AHG19656.1 flagellar motor switch protein FliM [Chania multitudinisentens RB-25]